jgi:hypothetical protein
MGSNSINIAAGSITCLGGNIVTNYKIAGYELEVGVGGVTGSLNMNANKVIGLAQGSSTGEALSYKAPVSAIDFNSGSADGPLDMGTQKISNVVDPTLAQDAATKNYVENGAVIQLNNVNVAAPNVLQGNMDCGNHDVSNINALTCNGNVNVGSITNTGVYSSLTGNIVLQSGSIGTVAGNVYSISGKVKAGQQASSIGDCIIYPAPISLLNFNSGNANGPLAMNNKKITGQAEGTIATDSANCQQVVLPLNSSFSELAPYCKNIIYYSTRNTIPSGASVNIYNVPAGRSAFVLNVSVANGVNGQYALLCSAVGGINYAVIGKYNTPNATGNSVTGSGPAGYLLQATDFINAIYSSGATVNISVLIVEFDAAPVTGYGFVRFDATFGTGSGVNTTIIPTGTSYSYQGVDCSSQYAYPDGSALWDNSAPSRLAVSPGLTVMTMAPNSAGAIYTYHIQRDGEALGTATTVGKSNFLQGTAVYRIAGWLRPSIDSFLYSVNVNNTTTVTISTLPVASVRVCSVCLRTSDNLPLTYVVSDRRMKEAIRMFEMSIDFSKIGTYHFNYIGDPRPRLGFMAQDIAEHMPELKNIAWFEPTEDEPHYKIDQAALIPVLWHRANQTDHLVKRLYEAMLDDDEREEEEKADTVVDGDVESSAFTSSEDSSFVVSDHDSVSDSAKIVIDKLRKKVKKC